MSLDNLNTKHFTVADKTAISAALTALENALNPKFVNLTAEERKKYGSINEQNKLIVNKVKDYRNSNPNLSSPDVDWVEFQLDYDDRDYINNIIQRVNNLVDGLGNNKVLADFDNFQDALTDYNYSKYKATTKTFGFEEKCSEIGQFFSKTSTNINNEEPK